MIARTHEVEAALKNVCEDVDDLHVSLSNVATSLHLLSNMQFTENRTYQEDESTRVDSAITNIKAEVCVIIIFFFQLRFKYIKWLVIRIFIPTAYFYVVKEIEEEISPNSCVVPVCFTRLLSDAGSITSHMNSLTKRLPFPYMNKIANVVSNFE